MGKGVTLACKLASVVPVDNKIAGDHAEATATAVQQ